MKIGNRTFNKEGLLVDMTIREATTTIISHFNMLLLRYELFKKELEKPKGEQKPISNSSTNHQK